MTWKRRRLTPPKPRHARMRGRPTSHVTYVKRIVEDTGADKRTARIIVMALFDLFVEDMLRDGRIYIARLGEIRADFDYVGERTVGGNRYTHNLRWRWVPTKRLRSAVKKLRHQELLAKGEPRDNGGM